MSSAKNELSTFVENLNSESYEQAVTLIRESQAKGGRIHITGIGKPGQDVYKRQALRSPWSGRWARTPSAEK